MSSYVVLCRLLSRCGINVDSRTVNLLANAYAGSNPALPTIFICNDLGSFMAPFFVARETRVGSLWAHFCTLIFGCGCEAARCNRRMIKRRMGAKFVFFSICGAVDAGMICGPIGAVKWAGTLIRHLIRLAEKAPQHGHTACPPPCSGFDHLFDPSRLATASRW